VETIAQLRREANQWKDQSRNWQEHFLRAEQERCAHSSRIDEIIVDKLHVNFFPSCSLHLLMLSRFLAIRSSIEYIIALDYAENVEVYKSRQLFHIGRPK